MTPEDVKQIINSSQVFKFTSLGLAQAFVEHGKKPQLIVHGDDGRFWVASSGIAQTLEKAGYELIE